VGQRLRQQSQVLCWRSGPSTARKTSISRFGLLAKPSGRTWYVTVSSLSSNLIPFPVPQITSETQAQQQEELRTQDGTVHPSTRHESHQEYGRGRQLHSRVSPWSMKRCAEKQGSRVASGSEFHCWRVIRSSSYNQNRPPPRPLIEPAWPRPMPRIPPRYTEPEHQTHTIASRSYRCSARVS
jgi:hypothetical protein